MSFILLSPIGRVWWVQYLIRKHRKNKIFSHCMVINELCSCSCLSLNVHSNSYRVREIRREYSETEVKKILRNTHMVLVRLGVCHEIFDLHLFS